MMRLITIRTLAASFLVGLVPYGAFAIEFDFPLECTLGKDCFIQQYVDHDSSPGYLDYACGRLSYDGHTGTDIRVRNLEAMREGYTVVAAAAGTVKGLRDDMDDKPVTKETMHTVKDRECGNGVLIEHDNGFQTQYCHLKKGSIQVEKGDSVIAGQRLGQVGLSGLTEFPHLEFVVRHHGEIVDPFTGTDTQTECGEMARSLWSGAARAMARYVPTGVLNSGFTTVVPSAEDVREGDYAEDMLESDSQAIVFWVDSFGLLDNDVLSIRLFGPDDEQLAEHSEVVNGSKALQFKLIGKRLSNEAWPAGTYRGEYEVMRISDSASKRTPAIKHSQQVSVR